MRRTTAGLLHDAPIVALCGNIGDLLLWYAPMFDDTHPHTVWLIGHQAEREAIDPLFTQSAVEHVFHPTLGHSIASTVSRIFTSADWHVHALAAARNNPSLTVLHATVDDTSHKAVWSLTQGDAPLSHGSKRIPGSETNIGMLDVMAQDWLPSAIDLAIQVPFPQGNPLQAATLGGNGAEVVRLLKDPAWRPSTPEAWWDGVKAARRKPFWTPRTDPERSVSSLLPSPSVGGASAAWMEAFPLAWRNPERYIEMMQGHDLFTCSALAHWIGAEHLYAAIGLTDLGGASCAPLSDASDPFRKARLLSCDMGRVSISPLHEIDEHLRLLGSMPAGKRDPMLHAWLSDIEFRGVSEPLATIIVHMLDGLHAAGALPQSWKEPEALAWLRTTPWSNSAVSRWMERHWLSEVCPALLQDASFPARARARL